MRSRPRPVPAFLLAPLLVLSCLVTAAGAVEVRQSERTLDYFAFLTRAYAPCTAPNDVTASGKPACAPAVTSICPFATGTIAIEKADDTHVISAEFIDRLGGPAGGPPECATGVYYLDVTMRTSADRPAACPSGHCTFADTRVRLPFAVSGGEWSLAQRLDTLLPPESSEADVQILGAMVVAPDGLPIAGVSTFDGSPSQSSNLTVPRPACTDPGSDDACDVPPWDAPCDFESGEIEWIPDPVVHVTMRKLTGTSPLCTTGTYRVDTTVRITVDTCTNGARCTLVDQEVSLPVNAGGRDLDASARLSLVGITATYRAIEVVGLRVLDPTGAVVAARGLAEVRSLVQPRVAIAADRIRLQGTFPRPFGSAALDPLQGDGLTVSVSDRNGTIFDVTIPPERWQVQPPIGTRWDYKDSAGVLNGVVKAQLKRITKKQQIVGYALKLEARGVDLSAADFPGVTLNLTLPGVPSGVFESQQHRTCKLRPGKLDCR